MANLPEFVYLDSEEEYRKYYIEKYCNRKIETWNHVEVKFYSDKFEDAFFESVNNKKRDKTKFSIERAKRIDWVEAALKNENAEIYQGWDRDKKQLSKNRRVVVISPENYVVILNLLKDGSAKFITAYLADSPMTAKLIKKGPKKTLKNDY